MWKIFFGAFRDIGEMYKIVYLTHTWWYATLLCIINTILGILFIIPHVIHLLWASWKTDRLIKEFNREYGDRG